MKQLTQDAIKKAVGEKAATFVQDDMIVGLGTGTTATWFIDSLIKRCRAGLRISVISTSSRSLQLAKSGGIAIADINQVTQLDLTVDGADEIDPQNCMIKGGGGALAREKILASSSKKMIVIIDESKLVGVLGKFGVPIEILPFCYLTTLAKIRKAGFDGKMRYASNGSHYITDNGNFIFDIHTPQTFSHPEQAHDRLATLPGVVETGFFFNLPVQVLIGYKDGSVVFREERQWTKQ
jgi:ribose 5-phosphate isomerase A